MKKPLSITAHVQPTDYGKTPGRNVSTACSNHLSESDIQKQCLEWLNYQPNTKAWRRNSGAHVMEATATHKRRFIRFGQKGMSDIEGIVNGRHLEIEIKRHGKRPTSEQDAWLAEIRLLGGIAFYVTSLDELMARWSEIALAEYQRRKP